MGFSLRARWVFPVDRPAIRDGVVGVEGSRVSYVGEAPQSRDVIDLGDVALLPGFVNAHTHLEFSDLRAPLGRAGMALPDWIRLVIAERSRGGADAVAAIASGLAESARAGVAAIGEIAQAADNGYADAGIKLALLLEVIGFSRARAESAFAAVEQRLVGAGAVAGTSVGLSPHAPYTVSPELLQKLVALSRARRLPVAMHLAESREELELLREGSGPFRQLLEERSMWDADAIPRGSRPLDYLRMLANAPRAIVVHGNYLDEEEQDFLTARADRMSIVYCPRTHAYFQHAPYPLRKLLERNVRVALGTDSRASNPDLDLLGEMRFVARQFPELDPREILRIGTLAGARALGVEQDCGSIAPGKLANVVTVPMGAGASDDEVLSNVLSSDDAVSAVWLRGERVVP